ncbi:hypothetical protein [Streptomyces sp. MNP-20]|uniref:hypothetical protein n=1 Tax=Streptomyces sp. MNP-20 TaxID=2721165 RepID=UPI00155169A7|nr:hypothetical protein [Streptomyces sp. MNP-20]
MSRETGGFYTPASLQTAVADLVLVDEIHLGNAWVHDPCLGSSGFLLYFTGSGKTHSLITSLLHHARWQKEAERRARLFDFAVIDLARRIAGSAEEDMGFASCMSLLAHHGGWTLGGHSESVDWAAFYQRRAEFHEAVVASAAEALLAAAVSLAATAAPDAPLDTSPCGVLGLSACRVPRAPGAPHYTASFVIAA